MATLLGIAWREGKRAPMQELETAQITTERGVHADSRGKPGKRQVSILSRRQWDEVCAELGQRIDWTARRSNLLVDDLPLTDSQGAIIRIGEVELEVCVEVDPCSRMDEACLGLKDALAADWRGGVGCRVVRGGTVRVGDAVEWLTAR